MIFIYLSFCLFIIYIFWMLILYIIHLINILRKEEKIVFKTFISYVLMLKKYEFLYYKKMHKNLPYHAIYIIPDSNYDRVKLDIEYKFYSIMATTITENYNNDFKYHYRYILFDPISYFIYIFYLVSIYFKNKNSRFTKNMYE